MPNDRFMKLANTLHRSLIKVTAGKRGWDFYGMPVIKLTTTGRISGKGRSVMLTSRIKLNDDIFIGLSRSLNKKTDIKFNFGGPILSDKITFFTNVRTQEHFGHYQDIFDCSQLKKLTHLLNLFQS